MKRNLCGHAPALSGQLSDLGANEQWAGAPRFEDATEPSCRRDCHSLLVA